MQGTKPQTLAYGLNDYPPDWPLDGGEIPHLERLPRRRGAYTKEELLTIGPLLGDADDQLLPRTYWENHATMGDGQRRQGPGPAAGMFTQEIARPPESGRQSYHICAGRDARGGHLPQWKTELLAKEVRAFFRQFR